MRLSFPDPWNGVSFPDLWPEDENGMPEIEESGVVRSVQSHIRYLDVKVIKTVFMQGLYVCFNLVNNG
jgi:hypothetical protein